MTSSPDLVECANCDCWYAAASLDDVFYHATSRCRCDIVSPSAARDPAEEVRIS